MNRSSALWIRGNKFPKWVSSSSVQWDTIIKRAHYTSSCILQLLVPGAPPSLYRPQHTNKRLSIDQSAQFIISLLWVLLPYFTSITLNIVLHLLINYCPVVSGWVNINNVILFIPININLLWIWNCFISGVIMDSVKLYLLFIKLWINYYHRVWKVHLLANTCNWATTKRAVILDIKRYNSPPYFKFNCYSSVIYKGLIFMTNSK